MQHLTKSWHTITSSRAWLAIIGLFVAMVVVTPAPADAATSDCMSKVLRAGARGTCVTQLQNDLNKRGFTVGRFGSDGSFGTDTVNGVKAYQRYHGLKVDGVVGPQTWSHIAKNPTAPKALFAHLDKRCFYSGNVMCVDLSQKKAYAFTSGKYVRSFVVRPGGKVWNPTDKVWEIKKTNLGQHWVSYKKVDGYSSKYKAPMPYTVNFNSEGEAFHFSQSFATYNYGPDGTWGSNGCVNIGNMADAKWIYYRTPIGGRVIVQS